MDPFVNNWRVKKALLLFRGIFNGNPIIAVCLLVELKKKENKAIVRYAKCI